MERDPSREMALVQRLAAVSSQSRENGSTIVWACPLCEADTGLFDSGDHAPGCPVAAAKAYLDDVGPPFSLG